ncbi:phage tail tape measure protein [Bacillus sp. J33]|uniref:phage tail tape measure protein n=1 Tax=Bacillus sp. J33 TaxID=935836 RepID=UPI0004B29FDE|nr:phage tail tape measure protein [Bacillus sp. J33]
MERIEGLSIGLDLDSLTLERGLTGLRDRMRTLNSEMTANLSAFDRADRSVEKYETRLQGLNRKLTLQNRIVQASREEYERMVREFGEGSREAEAAARSYNNQIAALRNLERSIDRTTQELNDLREEQERSEGFWVRFNRSAENAGSTLSGVGDKLKGIGQTMTMSVTTPLIGLGGLALKSADDFRKAQGKMQASLGLTEDETKKLTKAAQNLWKEGFGENIEDISATMTTVEKNMGALSWATQDELKEIGKSASVLFERFEADVNDTTKVANALMMNFGSTSKEAFDLLTWGFQNGLDFSGEFLDTVNEYAPQFAAMGMSAEEMFGILEQGAVNGAFNLDKVGDAVKEFNIRIKDGSKTTSDAMGELSSGTQKIWKSFLKGKSTGKEVMDAIIKELSNMDNQVKANQIAVGVFGTQWEDLESDAIYAMGNVQGELSGLEGATEKAGETLQKNLGARVQRELRELGASLLPLANVLMDTIEPALDAASEKVEDFTEWMKGLSPEGQKSILVIGGLAAATGPLITGLGFAATGISGLITGLGLLSGPVGLTVLGIAGLGAGFLALDKEMDKPIIKSDIFAGEISKATEKAVGSYMKLDEDATAELNSLAWSQATITQTMSDDMVAKYQEMGDQVLQAMKENHTKQLEEQQRLFAESDVLTEQEEAKRMAQLKAKQLEEIEAHNATQARIKEIWQTAVDEKRGITEAEGAELERLQASQRVKAVEELSKSKQEQETILNNLKANKSIIEAETAANTVRKSVETRDKVVKEAQKEYDQKIATIELGRDVTGTIKKNEADAMIKEAERARDESVTKAQDMHYDVVKEAQAQAGEHVDKVNWETGEVLAKWDSMYNGVLKAWNWVRGLFGKEPLAKRGSLKETGRQKQRRQNARLAPGYAIGTPSSGHPGGPAIVGEEGPELAHIPGKGVTLLGMRGAEFHSNLPKGSSVLPNPLTENLLKSYGFPGYKDGIGDYFDVFLKGAGNVWDLVKNKFNLTDGIFPSWMKNHIGNPLSVIGDMAKGSIKEMWDNWFGDIGSVSSGSGVSRWSGIAAKALMMTGQYTKANLDRLLYQMKTESGGNPRAINLWDINAKRGIPSKGLMQVIDPTFRAYAMPGFNSNIYDPLSNILASIRYAVARYGSLTKAYRGVGYATGGLINNEGLYRLAEGGWPEWVIPTDPSRRTEAMKLLALAGREITGNKRPNQLPNIPNQNNDDSLLRNLLNATLQQNQILLRILQKDTSFNVDGRELAYTISPHVKEILDFNNDRNKAFEGRAF